MTKQELKPWYEEEYMVNIGMITTGQHSIYDFETIVDMRTGEIVFANHDDSDSPTPYSGVLDFFKERGEEREFYSQVEKLLNPPEHSN